MNEHGPTENHDRDRAILYLLGELNAGDSAAFEKRLSRDASLRREVEGLRGLLDELALAAPEEQPPARLRARVIERVRSGAPLLDRADRATWEPTEFEGVDLRRLFVDAASRRQTVLVRMRPGTSDPSHAHGGHEECYVVEGDLIDGELRMTAGDFTCFPAGSQHGPLTTRGGCLLLVQSSLDDAAVSI